MPISCHEATPAKWKTQDFWKAERFISGALQAFMLVTAPTLSQLVGRTYRCANHSVAANTDGPVSLCLNRMSSGAICTARAFPFGISSMASTSAPMRAAIELPYARRDESMSVTQCIMFRFLQLLEPAMGCIASILAVFSSPPTRRAATLAIWVSIFAIGSDGKQLPVAAKPYRSKLVMRALWVAIGTPLSRPHLVRATRARTSRLASALCVTSVKCSSSANHRSK